MEFIKRILKKLLRIVAITLAVVSVFALAIGVTSSLLESVGNGYYVKDGELPPYKISDAYGNTGQEANHSMIRLQTNDEAAAFFCSGAVVSNTYAITADHCFRGAGRYDAKVFNREGVDTKVVVEAVASIEELDLALVQGDFRDFTKVPLDTSSYNLINKNGPFLTCGFPYGENPICVPFRPMSNMLQFIVGTGFMYPGMSGGPVVDMGSGVIIGVNRAIGISGVVISPVTGLFARSGIKVVP